MEDIFRFADELGPAKVIHVYDPSVGQKAVLVVDNVARGPAIGGLRIAPDVSPDECFRLARAMTLKNAAADLPHGGGKSVIDGDLKMPKKKRHRFGLWQVHYEKFKSQAGDRGCQHTHH